MDEHCKICLHEPAESFPDSFLLGNGWMGQSLLCQPCMEVIGLSHITFFSGDGRLPEAEPDAPEAFRLAREAALRKDWPEVSRQTERFMGRKGNYGTSLPVGSLIIAHHLCGCSEYTRSLDLRDGVAECSFLHGDEKHRRIAFTSHPDQVFCLHEEDTEGLTVSVQLAGEHLQAHAEGNTITFSAQALENLHSDGTCGVRLRGILRVISEDGNCTADGAILMLRNVHRWTLLLSMITDFDAQLTEPVLPDVDWQTLLLRHREDFSALSGRAALSLPDDPFSEKLYAFGRYLTISASREDSPLPMTLQGVWNDNVACQIGWTCDMHLDINTQMNYWLSQAGNLSECHLPLFRWMQEHLIPMGQLSAARHYGLTGWVGELVANAWGYAEPYWHRSLAPCPACGFWLALDCMEHYRTTQDAAFLAGTVFPILDGAVDFALAYLFRDGNGTWQSGPSISPENGFRTDFGNHFASISPTFEICLTRALLTDWLEADAALGSKNASREAQIKEVLPHLPPIRISNGIIAEWTHDLPPKDPQHRHVSSLIGLYPLGQITPEGTPQLSEAARETIRRRLTPYAQWEDTGWARNMLLLYSARLGDGQQAWFHLHEAQENLMRASMLIMHPSTRGASSFAPVWELDGNTGIAMGISEMLMQSPEGYIHLLPALPEAWASGSFHGFLARGSIEVDAEWKDGGLLSVGLTPKKPCTIRVRWKNIVKEMHLNAHREIISNWEEEP